MQINFLIDQRTVPAETRPPNLYLIKEIEFLEESTRFRRSASTRGQNENRVGGYILLWPKTQVALNPWWSRQQDGSNYKDCKPE